MKAMRGWMSLAILTLVLGLSGPTLAGTVDDFTEEASALAAELDNFGKQDYELLEEPTRASILALHERVLAWVNKLDQAEGIEPNDKVALYQMLGEAVGKHIVELSSPFEDVKVPLPSWEMATRDYSNPAVKTLEYFKALSVFVAMNSGRDIARAPHFFNDRARSKLLKKLAIRWRDAMESATPSAKEALGAMAQGMLNSEPMRAFEQNRRITYVYRAIAWFCAIVVPFDFFPTRMHNSDWWSSAIYLVIGELAINVRSSDSGLAFARIVGNQIRPGLYPALQRGTSRVARKVVKACSDTVAGARARARRPRSSANSED